MEKLVRLFKALGDPTRLEIVSSLMAADQYATELVNVIDKEQSTISRHLKTLKDANIIRSERSGKNIIYSIRGKRMYNKLVKFGVKRA